MDVATVAADLRAEQNSLDALVAPLTEEQWRLPTPSPGWTITDQIAHLAYFDRAAAIAITDPDGFPGLVGELASAASGGEAAIETLTLDPYRRLVAAEMLAAWRTEREALAAAAATLRDDDRIAWYGPSMGAKSFLTARLMEAWAHGQDVADALGVQRRTTDRLHHIAQLGFITRKWSYMNRSEAVPDDPVRVALDAPSGDAWTFGPPEATESVSGPAEDFCLVVTQRRHVDDTALVTTPLGRDWMLKAQAFAGPPTDGPAPGTRP